MSRAVPPALPRIGAMTEATLYEQLGGMPFFERLVDRFYDGVETDEVLRPLYPDQEDLAGARRRLTLFLVQYWGGLTTYLEERGHPRLRARHFPFAIGTAERDRWLVHMRAAIDASDAPADARSRLHEYMTMAAEAMRNREDAVTG
jgi:hemoglobin